MINFLIWETLTQGNGEKKKIILIAESNIAFNTLFKLFLK